jgi:hypothetical protein
MKHLRTSLLILILLLTLHAPRAEAVVHFGGSIGTIIGCVNTVIYTVLGPPNGGPYLWSPSVTKTYSFGPPRRGGQWMLGNAGPSYFCIESIFPIIVHSGLLMIMSGSSQ